MSTKGRSGATLLDRTGAKTVPRLMVLLSYFQVSIAQELPTTNINSFVRHTHQIPSTDLPEQTLTTLKSTTTVPTTTTITPTSFSISTESESTALPTSTSTPTPLPHLLSTPLIIGITVASTLTFLALLSLLIFFLRRRRSRSSRSKPNLPPSQSNHELLLGRHFRHSQPNQSSTTLVAGYDDHDNQLLPRPPPRVRTPIPFAKPFAHLKKASQDLAARMTPGREREREREREITGLDGLREREGYGYGYGYGHGYNGYDAGVHPALRGENASNHRNERRTGRERQRETTESVVESLDWDWKRVYVYPFAGQGGASRTGSKVSLPGSIRSGTSRLGSETVCFAEGSGNNR